MSKDWSSLNICLKWQQISRPLPHKQQRKNWDLKNLENIRYTKILKLTTTNVVWAKGNFQLFLTNQWLFHYPEIGLYCPKYWAKMYVLQTQYCWKNSFQVDSLITHTTNMDNIWNKVKMLYKAGQDHKTFISAFT